MKEGEGAVADTAVTVRADIVHEVVLGGGDVNTISYKVKIAEGGVEDVVAGTAHKVPMKNVATVLLEQVGYNPMLALLESSGVLII